MQSVSQLGLLIATSPGWAAVALADFDAFLKDHASCERKAAAAAMGFVARHSEMPELTEPMATLAREELDHFLQVYRLIQKRGQTLGQDERDPYVNCLLSALRRTPRERLLDRLVVGGLIEARSAERLALVSEHLPEGELKSFYAALARSEAGHYKVFRRMAERIYPTSEVEEAWLNLATHEAKVLAETPWRAAVH